MPAKPLTEELADPHVLAKEIVSGWSAAEIDACNSTPDLTGNWKYKAPPTAQEYINHCLIVDKETGQLVRFELWDAQAAALEEILAHDFIVNVKGRQTGVTWLILALMAYEADFGGNRLFPIGRQSEEYAKDAVTRLMYLRGLNPITREPLPESPMNEFPTWRRRIVAKTTTQIVLENGSAFHALTATETIGRGGAHYRGLADEFAFWPWQRTQRKALESSCARLDIVSSGNGEGDDFQQTWEQAAEGKGIYHPLFISATADPRRDAKWFRQHVDEDADPDGAAREYARCPEDAFRAPSGTYFKKFTRASNVAEFDVVKNWRTDVCVDWGLAHPAAGFIQVSPSGQPFMFDEYEPVDEPTTTDFGVGIKEKLAAYGLDYKQITIYADPAGKARNQQTKLSDFAVFKGMGLRVVGVPSKVYDGCVLMREAIAADEDRRFMVHPRCTGFITAATNVKPHRNDSDIYDTDHATYSHPLDMVRYWCINRWTRLRKGSGGTIIASGDEGAVQLGGW